MGLEIFDLTEEEKEGLDAIEKQDIEEYEEELRQEGVKTGKEQTLIETIKNMLSSNLGYDIISKVTGKSISQIKQIEGSM